MAAGGPDPQGSAHLEGGDAGLGLRGRAPRRLRRDGRGLGSRTRRSPGRGGHPEAAGVRRAQSHRAQSQRAQSHRGCRRRRRSTRAGLLLREARSRARGRSRPHRAPGAATSRTPCRPRCSPGLRPAPGPARLDRGPRRGGRDRGRGGRLHAARAAEAAGHGGDPALRSGGPDRLRRQHRPHHRASPGVGGPASGKPARGRRQRPAQARPARAGSGGGARLGVAPALHGASRSLRGPDPRPAAPAAAVAQGDGTVGPALREGTGARREDRHGGRAAGGVGRSRRVPGRMDLLHAAGERSRLRRAGPASRAGLARQGHPRPFRARGPRATGPRPHGARGPRAVAGRGGGAGARAAQQGRGDGRPLRDRPPGGEPGPLHAAVGGDAGAQRDLRPGVRADPRGGARASRALRAAGEGGGPRGRRRGPGGAPAPPPGDRQSARRGPGAPAGPERQGVPRRPRPAVTAQHARSRFERLAAHFRPRARAAPALEETYWQNVRELFTRDLTREGLKELLQREAQDTFRFFTREVPYDDLRERPWYRRWPRACWRTFLAMAYRLSPWRRILFAASVPVLALSWLSHFVEAEGASIVFFPPLTLVAGSALFFLLALELRDKLSLKGDLEVARQIQFGLLPFEPIAQDGFEIRTAMRPANTVGGDYFDVVEIGPGRLAVVVGDVAGKGMPAALLMALLQGSLRTLLVAGFRGGELLAKLNAHLCANIPANRLVTFFYGELETDTGALAYVNAGHNPPFLLPARSEARPLSSTGTALGILETAAFGEEKTRLEPGDRLFLYTDGVTEAENSRDEAYGEERLLAYLALHREEAGQGLVDGVVQDVLAFCGTTRTRDDMTLMCLSRAGSPRE